MKKRLFIIAMTWLTTICHITAQGTNPLPNDSIENGSSSQIALESGMFVSDSVGVFVGIIDPTPTPYPGGPKSPARPRYVCLSGNTLYTFGQFDGYTLYIIREEEVVYAEEVFYEQPVITLPLVLSGTYTLVFADGDGRCYYAEIEL